MYIVKKRILVALLVESHYQATAIPSKAAKFVSSPPLAVATPCSMTSSLRVKQDRGFLILGAVMCFWTILEGKQDEGYGTC